MKLFQTYQLATTAKAEIRRNFMLLLRILTVECSRNSQSQLFIVTFGGQLVRRSAYSAQFLRRHANGQMDSIRATDFPIKSEEISVKSIFNQSTQCGNFNIFL